MTFGIDIDSIMEFVLVHVLYCVGIENQLVARCICFVLFTLRACPPTRLLWNHVLRPLRMANGLSLWRFIVRITERR